MTPKDVTRVLALAQSYDRRPVSEADVAAWGLVIGDLDYDDCRRAVVEHYAASPRWAAPSDVAARVRALQRDRLQRASIPPPDPDLGPSAHRDALAASVRAAATGSPQRKAIDR